MIINRRSPCTYAFLLHHRINSWTNKAFIMWPVVLTPQLFTNWHLSCWNVSSLFRKVMYFCNACGLASAELSNCRKLGKRSSARAPAHTDTHTQKQTNSTSLCGVRAVHYPSWAIERGPLVIIYRSNHDHDVERCSRSGIISRAQTTARFPRITQQNGQRSSRARPTACLFLTQRDRTAYTERGTYRGNLRVRKQLPRGRCCVMTAKWHQIGQIPRIGQIGKGCYCIINERNKWALKTDQNVVQVFSWKKASLGERDDGTVINTRGNNCFPFCPHITVNLHTTLKYYTCKTAYTHPPHRNTQYKKKTPTHTHSQSYASVLMTASPLRTAPITRVHPAPYHVRSRHITSHSDNALAGINKQDPLSEEATVPPFHS